MGSSIKEETVQGRRIEIALPISPRWQSVVMTSSYDSQLNSPLFYRNMDRPTGTDWASKLSAVAIHRHKDTSFSDCCALLQRYINL